MKAVIFPLSFDCITNIFIYCISTNIQFQIFSNLWFLLWPMEMWNACVLFNIQIFEHSIGILLIPVFNLFELWLVHIYSKISVIWNLLNIIFLWNNIIFILVNVTFALEKSSILPHWVHYFINVNRSSRLAIFFNTVSLIFVNLFYQLPCGYKMSNCNCEFT